MKSAGYRKLVRDYIYESLYHPEYGYFSKNANIFSLEKPLEFRSFDGARSYQEHLLQLYQEQTDKSNNLHQLWSTPSELFKPWYGYGIANYITQNMDAQIMDVFEVGAGNGGLCINILDYLRENYPSIYKNLTYNIIEVSQNLYKVQKRNILASGHGKKVQHHLNSIFDWEKLVDKPCFVILCEDNLPHDLIKFTDEGILLECVIVEQDECPKSSSPMLEKEFQPARDSLVMDLVLQLDQINYQYNSLKWHWTKLLPKIVQPESGNPWSEEYIPTMLYKLIDVLKSNFPLCSLIISDFHYLPGTIRGWNAPVVQTRLEGESVESSTLLVKKGLFDIFFPTNFEMMHLLLDRSFSQSSRRTSVLSHSSFMQKYCDFEKTRTKSGYNPLLDDFLNAKFLLSKFSK